MGRRKPEPPPKAPPAAKPAAVPASSVKTVRIDSLIPDAGNVRTRDGRAMSALESSVRQFGPARSIVIDGRDVVRAGNGTLEAAQAAGCTEVLVVKPGPGQVVAVQRDDWSTTEATAYSLADNQTGTLAAWNETGLVVQLRSLQSEGFNLDAVGFTDDEIDAMNERLGDVLLANVDDDPQGEWQGMPEFEHEDKTAIQSIHVHFKSREDVAAFADLVGQAITEKTKFVWYPKQEKIRYGESS